MEVSNRIEPVGNNIKIIDFRPVRINSVQAFYRAVDALCMPDQSTYTIPMGRLHSAHAITVRYD